MTRARDVADVQDNLGGAVTPVVAGKNIIINGGFDIFQRTSVSNTTDTYGLDRWYKTSSGSASNVSVTQQTTGVPLGSRYCMRVTMTGTFGYGNQYQIIETSNVAPLQGKTITITAKVRRSSGFAGSLTLSLEKSATVDAAMGATYSTMVTQGVSNASIPTGTTASDWYTLQVTTTIPNDGTANTLRVGIFQSQTESNCYWEMAQVQLEIGSVATSFSRAGGSIGGELALCQRYYETGNGYINVFSALQNNYPITDCVGTHFQVAKRTAPTVVLGTATAATCYTNSGNTRNITIAGFEQTVLSLANGTASYTTMIQPWTASAEL
jgi:hypothetical protein